MELSALTGSLLCKITPPVTVTSFSPTKLTCCVVLHSKIICLARLMIIFLEYFTVNTIQLRLRNFLLPLCYVHWSISSLTSKVYGQFSSQSLKLLQVFFSHTFYNSTIEAKRNCLECSENTWTHGWKIIHLKVHLA